MKKVCKRRHFSLSTLFLLGTCAALLLGLIAKSYHHERRMHDVTAGWDRAEQELARLRSEAKKLQVTDRTKLQFTDLESYTATDWHWRVHVPKRSPPLSLYIAFRDIPRDGVLPQTTDGVHKANLLTGEVRLSLAIHRNNGFWYFTVKQKADAGSGRGDFADATFRDLMERSGDRGWSVDRRLHLMAGEDTKQPVVLLRVRAKEISPETANDPNSELRDGILAWIE